MSINCLSNGEFATSSLDQTMNIWHSADTGKLKCVLSGSQEPIHCVGTLENNLITGSTGNRVGVRQGFEADSYYTSSKLRSDVIRGNFTAMQVLPMNRLLLLGQENGSITLIC